MSRTGPGTMASEPTASFSPELNEYERLTAWEFLQLLNLGFTIEQGLRLITVPHLSWHDADTLIRQHPDWPLEYVVEELS